MRRGLFRYRNESRDWAMARVRTPSGLHRAPSLEVYRQFHTESEPVGRLSCQPDEWMF